MKKPKLVKTDLDEPMAELISQTDHQTLGLWAADCAERVLHYFEEKCPGDERPRKAIEALRTWAKDGIFKMADIRRYSLAAHGAARSVKENDDAARSAARAAGQAIATAHVPTHASGASIYAASAVRDATNSMDDANNEKAWHLQHLIDLNKAANATPSAKQTLWRGPGKNVLRKF